MLDAEEKLDAIASQLETGAHQPEETVRSLLSWFGSERRGYQVVSRIRKELEARELKTEPDFEHAWIDQEIKFVREQELSEGHDPTFRIGQLEAANKPVTSVKPTDRLERAVTLMLSNDFSQLPVMTNARDVKGVVSWKTIGSRLAMKKECEYAKDAMEPAQLISQDHSLLEAAETIGKHDYVLVVRKDKTVSGVVTATDFNQQFRVLAEPFLLVGEIEKGIRGMLHGKFSTSDLQACKDPGDNARKVQGPRDLTFGEYIRLLENPDRWSRLRAKIDRNVFIEQLSRVRVIRNDVMHFNLDGLNPADLAFLAQFAQFLNRLRDLSS